MKPSHKTPPNISKIIVGSSAQSGSQQELIITSSI